MLFKLSQGGRRTVVGTDIPWNIKGAIPYYFGTISEARRALGIPEPQPPQRWSRDLVISELHMLDEQGVRLSQRGMLEVNRGDLAAAIMSYFGSFAKARNAAGLPEPERLHRPQLKWTPEIVLAEMIDLHEAGYSLAMSKAPSRLVGAGIRYFGSWEDAIEAIGLDYDDIRLRPRPMTRERLLQKLPELARMYPSMTVFELQERYATLSIHARKHFGTVEAASLAAGVSGWPIRKLQPVFSREETLAHMQQRYQQGEPMYQSAVSKSHPHLVLSARRYFWSWDDALDAAGVPSDSPHTSWTKESILAALRERHEQGLSLVVSHIAREDQRLYSAAIKHFGSYQAAAKEIDIEVPRLTQSWTKEKVIQCLREHADEENILPTTKFPSGLLYASRHYFGSVDNARKAAGVLAPKRIRWTRERIIQAIRCQKRAHGLVAAAIDGTLCAAAVRHFGSWSAACKAAGILS